LSRQTSPTGDERHSERWSGQAADSLKESQLAAGRGAFTSRRTSPTSPIETASLRALAAGRVSPLSVAPRTGRGRDSQPGSISGSKLSATQGNSEHLKPAQERDIALRSTETLRLGAGRSQVQILSPRSARKACKCWPFGALRRQPRRGANGAQTVRRCSRGGAENPPWAAKFGECHRGATGVHFVLNADSDRPWNRLCAVT
jgi:hypothetical protein